MTRKRIVVALRLALFASLSMCMPSVACCPGGTPQYPVGYGEEDCCHYEYTGSSLGDWWIVNTSCGGNPLCVFSHASYLVEMYSCDYSRSTEEDPGGLCTMFYPVAERVVTPLTYCDQGCSPNDPPVGTCIWLLCQGYGMP